MYLLNAPFNSQLEVVKINTDEKTKNRLQNIGFIAGFKLVLMQSNFGDVIVKVRDCRLAMNKDVARRIEVERAITQAEEKVNEDSFGR